MKLREKAIRAAITIFLCMLLSKLLNLKYPFFVALPSVMPITSSVEETLKAGRNRLFGTVIGAVVGVLLALISPGSPILSGIGIIIILYLCNFIRWGTSASIAGLVFIAIMLGIKGENPLTYSIYRILDTLIGITITIIVNNIVFHKDLSEILHKDLEDIANKLSELTKEKVCSERKLDLVDVLNEIESVKDQFHIYEEEIKFTKESSLKVAELRDTLNTLIDTYGHIKILSTISVRCGLSGSNTKTFIEFYGDNCVKSSCDDKELNVVFNYHIERILDGLMGLKKLHPKD